MHRMVFVRRFHILWNLVQVFKAPVVIDSKFSEANNQNSNFWLFLISVLFWYVILTQKSVQSKLFLETEIYTAQVYGIIVWTEIVFTMTRVYK